MAPVHRDHGESKALRGPQARKDHGESKALRGPQARKDLKGSLGTLLHSLSL